MVRRLGPALAGAAAGASGAGAAPLAPAAGAGRGAGAQAASSAPRATSAASARPAAGRRRGCAPRESFIRAPFGKGCDSAEVRSAPQGRGPISIPRPVWPRERQTPGGRGRAPALRPRAARGASSGARRRVVVLVVGMGAAGVVVVRGGAHAQRLLVGAEALPLVDELAVDKGEQRLNLLDR